MRILDWIVLILLALLLRSCMPIDITITHKIHEPPKPMSWKLPKWKAFNDANEYCRKLLQGKEQEDAERD